MSSRLSSPIQFDALARMVLFQSLPVRVLEEICTAGQTNTAQKGEFFFMQGDPASRLYVLLSGRLKLSQVNSDGQQILLRAIGPYNLFGAVALAQAEAYPVSAEAMEACTALSWSKADLMPFAMSYPQLALNAMQMMANTTQEFQERFRQQATEQVERRVAHTLLRLASQSGKKIETGVLIDLPLTRQDLAEMSGTTLYTVSRLLTQWESQGLVIADRGRIVIRYPHGLVSIAEG